MSEYHQPAPAGKDPELWRLAQKRASFKRHLSIYVLVNVFLWLVWAFTGNKTYNSGLPWPASVLLFITLALTQEPTQ
jgi:hypothetical protein